MISFDFLNATVSLAGALYVMLALVVWGVLRDTPPAAAVRLWSLGSIAAGLGLTLLALRDGVPLWARIGALLLMYVSPLLRSVALRLHCGEPPRGASFAGLVLVAVCALGLCMIVKEWQPLRPALTNVLLMAATGLLAWHARRAATRLHSFNAQTLAWTEWLLLAALALRVAEQILLDASQYPFAGSLAYGFLAGASVLAGLYGNLGYIGMVLDTARRAEAQAREAQAAEAMRREAAEHRASELRDLLAQRDTLASERMRMVQRLAYDIRQPLHNASSALQGAGSALRSLRGDGAAPEVEQAAHRLGRAQVVMGGMHAVLDNLLSAATLVGQREPVARQETELAFFTALVIGDLDPAMQARLRYQPEPGSASASVSVDPSLVRVALRNLLRNAFQHGGRDVAVELGAEIHAGPLSSMLVLSVTDDGPGLAANARPAIAPPGSEDVPPAHGLGLFIARRVATLHGGRLVLEDHARGGLQARLELALPPQTG